MKSTNLPLFFGLFYDTYIPRSRYIKMVIDLPIQHFPETMWRMYIINTGSMFNLLWAMVKPLVPEQNRARIEILKKKKKRSKKDGGEMVLFCTFSCCVF